MAKRNSKKKNSQPKQRNVAAVRACERQHTGGGFHNDRRNKRKDRNSWRKELDW